ncbi:response regulator transcription factor [Stappia sp. F7233]|uniref:Response regulator transcription factor n=1 Tax=Stappia albiluteola TaxID=2758565 RepID=A0A839AEH2_9HYPH|nr:response regulator transcription factor [Stappia albiluteola]MBA5777354.1 response regulator transcription factor [Stappia albiluteola]
MTHPDPVRDPRKATTDDALVYIVEDEADIRALLTETLGTYRFRAECFASGAELLSAIDRRQPTVILLDLGLPDMDGMELINRVRTKTAVPIIVLSARTHASDRIMGLEIGADDYVVKPFDPREVVARIRSLLRRLQGDARPEGGREVARFNGWTYEARSHRLVAPNGEETFLPTGEAALLEALLRAPKRVLSRDYLLDHGGRDDTLDRAIDVRISRIRKKLSCDDGTPVIRTIYGSGYMLTASVEWS